MASKRRKSNPPAAGKAGTPLDDRRRSLAEEEAKLREQMEQNQKLIEDAPKIARERARQRREELITRATRTERPGSRAALIDRRFYEVNVAAPAQHRRLRSERRQGRLLFFLLLILFCAAIFWLYYTVIHS